SSCGSGCGLYDAGTAGTLTASPGAGGAVGAWGGDCAATAFGASSCTLTPASASLAASVKFRFNLTVTGSGKGTVTGGGFSVHDESKSQAFDWGSQVTL